MKMIDEYKDIRINGSQEHKIHLETELVEMFYLWVLNGKGLKYIK